MRNGSIPAYPTICGRSSVVERSPEKAGVGSPILSVHADILPFGVMVAQETLNLLA